MGYPPFASWAGTWLWDYGAEWVGQVKIAVSGGLAQSVECVVRNDEAPGSKPGFSTFLSFSAMRHWCSGNIGASQALAPGSIPGWRTFWRIDPD